MLYIYNIKDLSFAVLGARGFNQTISDQPFDLYGSVKEIPRKPEISDAKT
jgi:hypothetical protein